jgi:hypothetical protein
MIHPGMDVLAHVIGANERDQQQNEKGSEPDGGAIVEDLQSTTSISGCGAHLGADGGEEVEDGKHAEDVFDHVDLHRPRIEKSIKIEVISVPEAF